MRGLLAAAVMLVSSGFSETFEIHITNRQAGCIETILYSLSEKSTGSLMFNAHQLRSMGKEIDSVPPLEFLFYILKKPYLIKYMINTKDRFFQWNAFISGFGEKCNREDVYAKIQEDLDFFAQEIGEKGEDLRIFVDGRDWKALVKYLLKRRL
jgi:hypothetical protein